MAHELEIVNGKACMAYAGTTPWHGLGTKVPSDLTPEQILEAANLDWTVEVVPTFIERNGKRIDAGHALVRTSDDAVLSQVSSDWVPVQNIDAFRFFHEFVMEGSMSMETAGSLKNGTIVWALAKTNQGFSIRGKDYIESYLLFTNYHKYGFATDIRFTNIRVVCHNTLMAAKTKNASSDVVRYNHTRQFDPEAAKKALRISNEYRRKYQEAAEFLADRPCTREETMDFLRRLCASSGEKRELNLLGRYALASLETQPGADLFPGTWWNTFNALTYAVDHLAGRSPETRLESAWYGSRANLKREALAVALEMAS